MMDVERADIVARRPHVRTTRAEAYRKMVNAASLAIEGMDAAAWRATVEHRAVPFSDVMADGAWTGQAVFVVGGGPSLAGFDWTKLRGRRTIAVNRAFEVLPGADIMFSMDSLYFRWATVRPSRNPAYFTGFKVWLDTYGFPYRGVHLIKSRGETGLSESIADGLCHGRNSGYAALNLAYCLGANPIFLLGFDMCLGRGGKTHFHTGYAMSTTARKLAVYAQNFKAVAPLLRDRGVRVVNLAPTSALTCFEKMEPREVLG